MRKLFFALLAGLTMLGGTDAFGQMSRGAIKRNNKRLMTYRGHKYGFKDKAYTAVGFSLSALNYYGDLAPKPTNFSTDLSFTRPALGISLNHRFGPRYTLVAGFMYGTLTGSDSKSADPTDLENGVFRYRRNLSFRNRIKELSVVASIDLFENQATYISRVAWSPYIFAGVAVFLHNPQGKAPENDLFGNPLPQGGKWVDLQPLGTEGQHSELLETDMNYGIKPYKRLQFSIPIGIGARFRLNEVFDLSGEIGFRYLFTDYIDDVSRNYVDVGVFGDNELAKAMSDRSAEIAGPGGTVPEVSRDGKTYNLVPGYGKDTVDNIRGNRKDKDIFMVTSVKLTYILGKSFHRAKFR